MPDDLRNDPFQDDDHDRVIQIAAAVAKLEKEIDALRDWRHETVAPVMIVVQQQQKQTAESISRLTVNVEKLLSAVLPLAQMPEDLRDHRDSDARLFREMQAMLAGAHEKMDRNRAERADGEKKTIIWAAGLMIAGLATIIGAMWVLIHPHLIWQ